MRAHIGLLLACAVGLWPGLSPAQSRPGVVASPLRSFDWTYRAPPEPGNRHWTSPDGIVWTETYPSGYSEVQRVQRVMTLGPCRGVVTVKAHEPLSQTFIPDPACPWMDLMFGSDKRGWRRLDEIRSVTTVYGAWSVEAASPQPLPHGCTGWAEGRWSRVDVWVGAHGQSRAEWTPKSDGIGPMAVRLIYRVRHGRLAGLDSVLVEGEPGPLDPETADYVSATPDPTRHQQTQWRLRLQPGPGGLGQGARPFARAVIASDHPSYLSDAFTFPARLAALSHAKRLKIVASNEAGWQFTQRDYDLTHADVRDALFDVALARAVHGEGSGCPNADSKCVCNS